MGPMDATRVATRMDQVQTPIIPVVGSWIFGGTTTVGSTASLGFSLRTTTAGGVICWSESFGSAPLEACSLSRSPPPPPPPALLEEAGNTYGLMSVTIPTTCCWICLRWLTTKADDHTTSTNRTV